MDNRVLIRDGQREHEHARLEAATLNAQHELAVAGATRGTRTVARLAVDHARTLLAADAAVVYAFDEERGLLFPLAETESQVPEPPLTPGMGAVGLAFDMGLPVVVEDYQAWKHAVPAAVARGTVSVLAVPLISGERRIGALGAWTYTPRAFTAEDEQLLTLFAAQVAPALEAARLSQQRDASARIFEALHEMAVATGGMREPGEVATLCVERACHLLEADSALLLWWDEENGCLRPLAGTLPGGLPPAFRLRPGQDAAGLAFQWKEPVVVRDYRRWGHGDRTALERGVGSAVAVPLMVRDAAVGALWVVTGTPRDFATSETEVLRLLASQIAPALEAARLLEASSAQVRELRALHNLAVGAGGLLEPERLAALAVREACTLLGADRALLRLYEPSRERLEALADSELGSPPPLRVGQGLAGSVFESARAIAVEDYRAWPNGVEWGRREGLVSALSVPLISHQRAVGTLSAFSHTTRRFTRAETRLLSLLAAQVAPALEAARLAADLQQRAHVFRVLHELAVAVGGILEPARLAQIMVDKTRELTGADRVTAGLYDADSGLIHVIADTDPQGGPAPPVAPGGGGGGAAFAARRSVRIPEAAARDRSRRAAAQGYRGGLAVPLLVQDRPIGVLTLLTRESRTFGDEEERLASLLVAQVAPAIEAARLHASLAASERELRESEARKSAILEAALDGVIAVDSRGTIVEFNPAAERAFGIGRGQALGRDVTELLAIDVSTLHPSGTRFETAGRRAGSGRFPVEVSVGRFCKDGHEMLTVSVRDLTEQKAAETARRESEERFRAVFDRAAIGIARLELDGRIIEANPALHRMLAGDGSSLDGVELLQLVHRDDRASLRLDRLRAGDATEHQADIRYFSGPAGEPVLWGNTIVSCVRGSDGRPLFLILMVEDITLRKAHEAMLEHRALHDPLTDLPNRSLLADRLQVAVAAAHRERRVGALLILDLDGFKQVNDVWGHHMGDVLLQRISARIRGEIRESDTVARLGGDEFAVVLPAAGGVRGAGRAARKLQDALEQPFSVDGHEVLVTASLGIALFPTHSEDPALLMRQADAAMYAAKRARRGCAIYSPARDTVD